MKNQITQMQVMKNEDKRGQKQKWLEYVSYKVSDWGLDVTFWQNKGTNKLCPFGKRIDKRKHKKTKIHPDSMSRNAG